MNKKERIAILEANALINEHRYQGGKINKETYLIRKRDVKKALTRVRGTPSKRFD